MLLFLISLHFGLWAQQNPAIVINELSASGQSTSEDDTGANSTWIELYNPSEETVNLRGWFLTDDYSYLPKWQFPEISLQAGEFLVVYTSGQNKTNPDSSLHTNFEFKPGGQFMGLVFTDGKTLVDEYKPGYGVNHIPQVTYGRAQKHSSIDLVGRKSPGKLLVPTAEDDESIGQSWKNNQSLSFDDGAWSNVTGSVGYDTREGTDQSGNLALGKVASQSSTWPGFTAEYAVDGVLTNFAHTADGDETPWWEVDLGESLLIGEVVLHNRRGCCNDRLNSIIVEIRNEAQEVIYTSEKLNPVAAGETPTSPGDELTLSLEDAPVHGRYVRVRKDPAPGTNTYLTLAEVEIIGSENYDQHITTNVQAAMKGVNASAYLRYGFTLEETEDIDELYLHAAFDGGFEAYLNGKQIASANAPDEVTYRSAAASDTPMYQEESIRVPKTYLQSGENILAVHVMNHHVDDQSLLMDLRLEAVKIGDPEKRYFYHPTPGTPNGNSVSGFTAKTIASHKGGFYEDPVELTLSAGAAGETLAFTLDGSVPSLTNGTLVRPATTSSIADTTFVIDRTTVIRSAAYQSDKWRNTISTYSFLFIDDVITSEVMNPEITGDERYSRSMREALEALPTVSLVMPNGAVNDDYLIATSVEWLEPGQSSSFQVDAGVRYFGGAFTDFDKENFRLYFKSEYGVSKLRYPLFEGFGRGIAPVEKFDQLELRAGSHDMVMRGFYMSNRFTDDTMLDMGNLNPHGRFVHLYINGTYWGQYHLRERWNADMHAQYLGGEKVEYEAINGNWNQGGWADPGEPYDGDGSFWETAKSLREDFEAIQDYVDVAHYVDFMLLYMFGRSENEYRTVAPATPGAGGFKFYLNDADGFLRSSGNRTGWKQPGRTNADGPGSIFSMLYKEGHPKFKALVADRIYEHYFNDGALTFEKNRDRLLQRCNEVETAFLAESARWGYRTPESWREARDNYINDVLTTRTEDVIVDFRGAGFLPAAEPPQVVVDGATLLSDSTSSYQQAKVELKATSGAVYYTLDGSDPYAIPNHAEHNTAEIRTLIGENAPKTAWIPDGPVAEDWKTNAAFDDAGWLQGTGGVGYETGNGYQDWIGINVTSMKGSNTSCLVRIPFELDETSLKDIGALTLLMRMDDGFVAYLNGVEVQRQNVNGDPQWNTKASSGHEAGNSWSTFDISPYIGVLTEGTNLLAIHGANLSLNSSDFLISAMLTAAPSNDQVNYLSANAETYEGSFSLTHSSLLKTRTFHNGEWSPLRTVWIEVTGNEAVLASEDQSSLIHCYPNPFDSQVTIEFQSSTSGSALLEIFDLSGAIMYHKLQDVRPGTVQFRLAPKGWSGGIYIMQLTAPDGQKHRGKLVHIN
ncbi:putative secreted protein (Por secretion system target) [Marinoscillum furvescens DSM 4134]|uniref:Putative secreted protein (Por secretion system target) n=2 Tax=Marinoscillum furvescens TaxID=1026 RepID=A0A3D9L3W6_MARFU|nr:putative secreted protein (Por secretion system target) [Marinoscillum furvescens DSM 4134]